MNRYSHLGIRPLINADATLTRLGGSLMPPEVLAAMAEAAAAFVDLPELQARVGARLAELTGNEAAYVCAGAAAGLTLATAACITGSDQAAVRRLPDLSGLKDEVIIQRGHRNGFERAVRLAGVRLIEISPADEHDINALTTALTSRTAAVSHFLADFTAHGQVQPTLPLETVIAAAHAGGVPVIVDAAAQLPPVENLWQLTGLGADLVIFSGGKDLRGPQSSGLILGRRDLIDACARNGNPHEGTIGRPMKVGKEEMVGLLAAVERYLQLDHPARAAECERLVAAWVAALDPLAGVSAVRSFPNEAGQPLPRARVDFEAAIVGLSRDEIRQALLAGQPAVAVARAGEQGIYLNPMTLEPGEGEIVLSQLLRVLGQR